MADPNFLSPVTNPFGLTDVGRGAKSNLVDIDGDGDLDAFVGNSDGNILFFRNDGDANTPSFTAPTTNPFGLVDVVGLSAAPNLVDIDGDGDLDAFVGNYDGGFVFFRNDGDANTNNPNFTARQFNPFGLSNVGNNAVPNWVDIDNDGDFDVFVGNRDGNILFFRNDGDANSPSFAAAQANPFGLASGNYPTPTFADIDEDGDLDAFVGNQAGNILFFRNDGDANNPSFAAAETNPFGLADTGGFVTPTLADIDNDGDLDAFVGNAEGNIFFFENNQSPVAVDDTATTNASTAIDISVLENDIDADGDTLSIDSFDTTSNLGATITENPDGSLSYDPNGQINLAIGETVTDSFTYTVSDGNGGTDNAIVNLTLFDPSVTVVEGDNSPPLEISGRTEETLVVVGNDNEADLGNGDDTTTVNGDGNVIDAGLGDDQTTVAGDDNTIETGIGSDIVEVTGESNTVETGSGTDDIDITGDNNTVEAGSGNDEIDITGDGTTLDAGNGNDDITVTGDASTIDAGSGNDVVVVTGDDNNIDGGRGDDDITGTGQNLIVDGGDGNDVIIINTNNGTLGAQVTGGKGFDMITGSLADDILLGNQDDDVIDGRDGDDIIEGNQGTDNLTGGAGADIFRFGTDAADGETNLIVDFQQGVDVLAIEHLGTFNSVDGGTTYDFSIGRDTLTIAFSNPVTLSATDFTDYDSTFV